jgi:hypothetical protein
MYDRIKGIDHSLLSDEIQYVYSASNVYNYCSAMCQLSSKVGRILSSDRADQTQLKLKADRRCGARKTVQTNRPRWMCELD